MGFIYKITSPTGRLYVGQTKDEKQRQSDYKCLRHRSKKSIIIWSIKKHGWDKHLFEVIENVPNEMMNDREVFWIQELKTFYPENLHGMNLTKGGSGVIQPWKDDVERVKKAKERWLIGNPTKGKKIPQEVRDKIAKSVSKYNIANGVKPFPICYEILRKKQNIAIVCYDLNGDFVSEFESITIAGLQLNIGRKCVNDALNGRQKHAGGFVFKRMTENYPYKIDVSGVNFFIRKKKNAS